MPNWCYTKYTATGSKEEVADLGKKMNDMVNMTKPLINNSFGVTWLGNLVHLFGGNYNKINCRGEIINIEEVSEEEGFLLFSTETAWRDMRETFDFIESKYQTIKFFFFAEGIMSTDGCWTNDKDGKHYPERYVLDQLDDDWVSYITLEEALKDVSKKVGKTVKTIEEAIACIEEFNEDEANEDHTICFYEVDIVDETGHSIKNQIKITTMKHTNFYKKIEEIKRQEIAELIKALNAHGGKFQWPIEDDDTERPIIAINPDSSCPDPTDVEVISVCVNSGRLELVGIEKNNGYEIPFTPEEVFAGHLSYIIDYIPETEYIKDVTEQTVSFPIANVSRDDLKERGFDVDNIDDDDMSDLAERMGDAYREIVFDIDLEAIINECFDFPSNI
jgi:hypothetical protein